MGATVIRTSGSEGGYLWKCENVRMDFCRCFPTGRTNSAEGGVAVHRGADHVELPRTARPEG